MCERGCGLPVPEHLHVSAAGIYIAMCHTSQE